MKGMYDMYRQYRSNPYHYYSNTPMYSPGNMYTANKMYPCPCCTDTPTYNPDFQKQFPQQYAPLTYCSENTGLIILKDYGLEPFTVNIEDATRQNNAFRRALWTGNHLQLTLMSINVGEDIGLEIHPNLDQFIRIEEGQGLVKMGDRKDNLYFQRMVYSDFAFIIPAGKWHNLVNTGNVPLKLYSIYAPPQHPYGTVHETKAIAQAAESNHSY